VRTCASNSTVSNGVHVRGVLVACFAVLLLASQLGGVWHEFAHIHRAADHALHPGQSGGCETCGAFDALASPLCASALHMAALPAPFGAFGEARRGRLPQHTLPLRSRDPPLRAA
jgi:hypothetical protein